MCKSRIFPIVRWWFGGIQVISECIISILNSCDNNQNENKMSDLVESLNSEEMFHFLFILFGSQAVFFFKKKKNYIHKHKYTTTHPLHTDFTTHKQCKRKSEYMWKCWIKNANIGTMCVRKSFIILYVYGVCGFFFFFLVSIFVTVKVLLLSGNLMCVLMLSLSSTQYYSAKISENAHNSLLFSSHRSSAFFFFSYVFISFGQYNFCYMYFPFFLHFDLSNEWYFVFFLLLIFSRTRCNGFCPIYFRLLVLRSFHTPLSRIFETFVFVRWKQTNSNTTWINSLPSVSLFIFQHFFFVNLHNFRVFVLNFFFENFLVVTFFCADKPRIRNDKITIKKTFLSVCTGV